MVRSQERYTVNTKLTHIGYLLSTGLVSLMTTGGAFMYLSRNERIVTAFSSEMVDGMNALGFSGWLILPMGILKLLGVIAIAVPQIPRVLKEWAYAGLFFNFLFAIGAHVFNPINPNDVDHWPAIVSLVLLVISRVLLAQKERTS